MQFVLGDVSVDGAGVEDMNIEGLMTLSDWTGTSRVTEGNLIAYSATSQVGTSNADFTAEGGSAFNIFTRVIAMPVL